MPGWQTAQSCGKQKPSSPNRTCRWSHVRCQSIGGTEPGPGKRCNLEFPPDGSFRAGENKSALRGEPKGAVSSYPANCKQSFEPTRTKEIWKFERTSSGAASIRFGALRNRLDQYRLIHITLSTLYDRAASPSH